MAIKKIDKNAKYSDSLKRITFHTILGHKFYLRSVFFGLLAINLFILSLSFSSKNSIKILSGELIFFTLIGAYLCIFIMVFLNKRSKQHFLKVTNEYLNISNKRIHAERTNIKLKYLVRLKNVYHKLPPYNTLAYLTSFSNKIIFTFLNYFIFIFLTSNDYKIYDVYLYFSKPDLINNLYEKIVYLLNYNDIQVTEIFGVFIFISVVSSFFYSHFKFSINIMLEEKKFITRKITHYLQSGFTIETASTTE